MRALHFAAVDLDGSVLGADDRFIGDVLGGLRHLRTLGLTIVIVTGRSMTSLRALSGLDDLLALCDRDVLVDEADVVFDRQSSQTHCNAALPCGTLARVADTWPDYIVGAAGRLTASNRRAATAYARAYRIPRSLITVGEPRGPISRIITFGEPPPPLPGVHVEIIRPFSAAVLKPSHGGKVAGLTAWLDRRFGEPNLERVIAIGDGDTDAELLSSSALGVAVQFSSPAAIAAASIHLDGPLDRFLLALNRPMLSVTSRTDARD